MALLQLSEPGQTPDPHTRRVAVGIDLGTTHSLVAALHHGQAQCLPDEHGRVLLPSIVRYRADGGNDIGFAAQAVQGSDPEHTISSAKRLMGRKLVDLPDAARLPYELIDGAGMVRVRTPQGLKSPVEVSAQILASLRQRAEDSFDADLFGAVITVPAYFDDAQRQATKDAAELAGLKVLRLINEPTAAALAYGLDNGSEGLYLIYDLGGGTFDVSLLRLSRGVFEVVATGGDSALGGDDFDRALAAWALTHAKLTAETPHDKQSMLSAARAAKEQLTSDDRARVSATLSAAALEVSIDREAFDAATRPLIERTIAVVRKVMRDARVDPADLQGVVLVGGATRMPAVRRAVAAYFGRPPLTNLDPDQVVALGAAIQANALAGNSREGELLLLDVIPLSLGVETMGGLVERIIERNTTIPVAKAQEFTTFKDGQTAMAIHVVQGERELVADCRSLARFELRGIPPMAAGAARIRVTFQVDADGLLSASARELTAGVEASVVVKPSYGLSDDDVARMLREGFGSADVDMRERVLREARVDAERLLLAARSALAADGDLLSEPERAAIDRCIEGLESMRRGDDPQAIRAAIDALAGSTEGFAAMRMNRSIRSALTGRRVEEV
ncbi:MAG TPA: Fe-S protein assembly chaperone HscA [Burkholderiaceae bacterium]|nr:Fe-S protein assembly chaperone HscA [Burkholderiaceae bacterium]